MSTSCDTGVDRPIWRLRLGGFRLDSRNCGLEAEFQLSARFLVGPDEPLHEANTGVGCAQSNTVSIIRIIERRSRETWGAVEAPGWRCVPRQKLLIFEELSL